MDPPPRIRAPLTPGASPSRTLERQKSNSSLASFLAPPSPSRGLARVKSSESLRPGSPSTKEGGLARVKSIEHLRGSPANGRSGSPSPAPTPTRQRVPSTLSRPPSSDRLRKTPTPTTPRPVPSSPARTRTISAASSARAPTPAARTRTLSTHSSTASQRSATRSTTPSTARARVDPASLPPSSPKKTGTPATAAASASPGIKAALAAMREKARKEKEKEKEKDKDKEKARRVGGEQEGGEGQEEKAEGAEEKAKEEETKKAEDDPALAMGLRPVADEISRARTTGRLNISSRQLTSLPAALRSLTPLASHDPPAPATPSEPTYLRPLTPTPSPRKRITATWSPPSAKSKWEERERYEDGPKWFEEVDLTVLKLGNNEIGEVEEELVLGLGQGGLRVLDLHANKITKLPDTMADCLQLTHLNLSHNALPSIPPSILHLPALTDLLLSHNNLTTAFPAPGSLPSPEFSFFPGDPLALLPSLRTLDLSHNRISSLGDPGSFPPSLVSLALSANPLAARAGTVLDLVPLAGGAGLPNLQHLALAECALAQPPLIPPSAFPRLRTLDLSRNELETSEGVLVPGREVKPDLEGAVVVGGLQDEWEWEGKVRVLLVGNPLDPRRRERMTDEWGELGAPPRPRRRSADPGPQAPRTPAPAPAPAPKHEPEQRTEPGPAQQTETQQVDKEPWELEAEAGALTEGGRRRLRAAAAAAAASSSSNPTTSPPPSPSLSSSHAHLLAQSYDPRTSTLNLSSLNLSIFSVPSPAPPPLTPPPQTLDLSRNRLLSIPLPALSAFSLAATLTTLDLSRNRRLTSSGLAQNMLILPLLRTLNLSGNALADAGDGETPLLEALGRMAPALEDLDISYNLLASLRGVRALAGVRRLGLEGNRVADVRELVELEGQEVGWREVDLRDNEIGKLDPRLGLLPLEILLVEGNAFRVPQRRVWEADGTRGLMRWLRERM